MGFLYSLVAPVAVSVTLSVYSTLERSTSRQHAQPVIRRDQALWLLFRRVLQEDKRLFREIYPRHRQRTLVLEHREEVPGPDRPPVDHDVLPSPSRQQSVKMELRV